MDDSAIVELFWARDEAAIRQSDVKYGRMLNGISYSLLSSREDAEECVSDTYLAAWNSMPTDRPDYLGAYLSKIIRRISINRYRSAHRQKRGGNTPDALIDELCECVPDSASLESEFENDRLREALNSFLAGLRAEQRQIFVLRYFCSKPLDEIAGQLGFTVGKVKTVLFRTRESLRKLLTEEELL